jgi:uncharacterized membrane protein
MPAIIITLLWIALILLLAYILFWLVAKMGLPEPVGLIARIIVGVACLLLLLGLFFPAMGFRFPGL